MEFTTVNQQIPTSQGNLEAIISKNNLADDLMIISHPHPAFDGSMDNKVVTTVARCAKKSNIQTIRYNYRGVGSSQGIKHSGDDSFHNELEDLNAVHHWALDNIQFSTLWLTGFSFGSIIAALHSIRYFCHHLTLIAPPIDRYPYPTTFNCNVSILQGKQDNIVSLQAVENWCKQHHFNLTTLETGHFFHGQLHELNSQLTMLWKQ